MGNVNMVYIIWKQTRSASAYRITLACTNCLRILDNVFDTVTKCLLPPFKSVEQSKLRHACLSKKKTFVEQTNHSPNDYEKVASDSIVKAPLQTIHEPEVIWNDNSDKQDERLW